MRQRCVPPRSVQARFLRHRRHQQSIELIADDSGLPCLPGVEGGVDSRRHVSGTIRRRAARPDHFQGLPRLPDRAAGALLPTDAQLSSPLTAGSVPAIAMRTRVPERQRLMQVLPDETIDAYYDVTEAAVREALGKGSTQQLTRAQRQAAEEALAAGFAG